MGAGDHTRAHMRPWSCRSTPPPRRLSCIKLESRMPEDWAGVCTKIFPAYQLLIEMKTQQIEKKQEQLDP